MTTSIQRAETELRMAALAYAKAEKAYHAACGVERKRQGTEFLSGDISKHSAEWREAATKFNAKITELTVCASALDAAINAEHQPEAL